MMKIRIAAALMVALIMARPAPAQTQTLKVGDPAPPLAIAHWIKGKPVDLASGKGNIYIIEFWATWCPPCIQSIPHITELQKQYRDKGVVVVAVSDEPKSVVDPFVKRMGSKMDYTVACDDRQRTSEAYMLASGQMGIPATFIVERTGRVAWIGSPFAVDLVLEEIVAGRYDIERAQAEALADMKFYRHQQMELLAAMQMADWDQVLKIGQQVADPNNPISKMLRMQVLNAVSWSMLTDERADKKYFKEALYLAKSAYDFCGCEDPSIIDTYARALFDNGRINDAVEQQRRAVALVQDGPMKAELQASLRRYEEAARRGG